MDFFNDDFGLGDSPRPKQQKNISKKSQTNKSARGNDELDDLLDQLLTKQKKKQQKANKQKQSELDSLAFLAKPNPNANSKTSIQNTHKKWESNESFNPKIDSFNPNTGFNFGIKNDSLDVTKNYQGNRNRPSSKSIYDDKGSQDNKSVQSGATAQANFGRLDNLDFLKIPSNATNNANQWPNTGSMRGMMKPPLRKRNQSKMGSQLGQDDMSSFSRLPQPNLNLNQQSQINLNLMKPPLPKKETSPPQKQVQSLKNIDSSQSLAKPQAQIIQKQKIVYVKQQPKNLLQQFDKQLKLIKQSHERQVSLLKQQLQKQIRSNKDAKVKLMKQFQQQKSKDKQLYEMLTQKNSQKLKDLYQWEIKRKSEAYQVQIQRLKKLSQLTLKSQIQSRPSSYVAIQSEKQQLRIKQKEIQLTTRKLQDRESFLIQKQRALQSRQYEFDQFRKRQQQKLQQQRKQLYNLESELQKKKLQIRKSNQQQKILISSEMAKQQFELSRRKQQLKLEKQELQVAKQLFERQKRQYQQFNANIMKQYKKKLRQLDEQKQYYQQKQIDLYKKIQTVQMMGDLKAGKKIIFKNIQKSNENRIKNNFVYTVDQTMQVNRKELDVRQKKQAKDNNISAQKLRNQNQNYLNKIYDGNNSLSPSHFQMQGQMQVQLQNLSKQKQNNKNIDNLRRSTLLNEKSHLKDYLLRTNRDNQRMRPHFL